MKTAVKKTVTKKALKTVVKTSLPKTVASLRKRSPKHKHPAVAKGDGVPRNSWENYTPVEIKGDPIHHPINPINLDAVMDVKCAPIFDLNALSASDSDLDKLYPPATSHAHAQALRAMLKITDLEHRPLQSDELAVIESIREKCPGWTPPRSADISRKRLFGAHVDKKLVRYMTNDKWRLAHPSILNPFARSVSVTDLGFKTVSDGDAVMHRRIVRIELYLDAGGVVENTLSEIDVCNITDLKLKFNEQSPITLECEGRLIDVTPCNILGCGDDPEILTAVATFLCEDRDCFYIRK